MNDDVDFTSGSDLSLDYGCAVTLRGTMWYFGGRNEYQRQVGFKVILENQIIYFNC